jgi:IclR family acetate operon transcriptional repressor
MKREASAAKLAEAGDEAHPRSARGDTVQSLLRALSLLKTLARHDQGLGLSEAAKETALAVSTAHRLLSTLQQENFVRFDPERGVWLVGVQTFIVGSAFLRSRELTGVARPIMRELMEESGETVNLAVEESGEAVYVAQIECRKTMRAIARPGGRAAMHCSGVGKALLAAMPDDDVTRILAQRGLPIATPKTIASASGLRADLRAIRRRGYAIDDEENGIGLRCVAAVVFDEDARPIAALSLSGPTARIGDDLLPSLGRAICDAADRITSGLGGTRPGSRS